MKRCQDYAELDLFSNECENPHVEKVQWAEIKTSTTLTNNITSLVFDIAKASGRKMLDLSRAQLMIDIDMSHLGSAPVQAPLNNMLHSMIENCIVKLNDNVLMDSNKMYNYSAYMLDLLDTTQEQKEGMMTAQCWYADTPKHFDVVETDGGNKGFKTRQELRGLLPLIGKLHSELFNQERYFINDVNINIELTLAKLPFYYMAKSELPAKYKMEIKDAKIYVPYVHVSEKTMKDIEERLQKTPVLYPIQRIHTKSLPIDTKSTSVTIEEISRGQMPKKVIIGVVTDKRKAGNLKLNPFNFDGGAAQFNITKMELNVDGMPYAKRGLTPDFKKDFGKTYMNFYESLNFTQDGTNTPAIPMEDYKNGYCLFPFNLNPGCCSDPGVFKKDGLLSLDIEFENAPTETLQVIVFGVYDNTISIDKDRQFSKDW